MIEKPFDAISKEDIDALITNEVSESKTLEYKQELPGTRDKDNKEFLADVSSFANASGGDIIYGLKAAKDEDGNRTGAAESVHPIEGQTPDDVILKLEQRIQSGLAPRLPVQIKGIPGWGEDEQGFVILLRVPNSFASPHMVIYKNSSKFYTRNSAGKSQLDVGELRNAFLATDSQAERIRQFRMDRLGKIVADETPVQLSTPHRLVLHLFPLTSFHNKGRLDLYNRDSLINKFKPIYCHVNNYRYTLDGFMCWQDVHMERREQGSPGYCQLFFDGTVEAVYAEIIRDEGGNLVCGGTGFFVSNPFEIHVVRAIELYTSGYKEFGLAPPIVVTMALLGCKGSWLLTTNSSQEIMNPHPIDRNTAIFPDIVIEDINDVDVPKVMKPIFDAVWNVCGYPRSENYDDDGNWNLR